MSAATPKSAPAPRLSALAPWCASVYPLAFFVAGAPAEVGPGDEGAYLAAAIELTPVTAPGTPLAALAGGFTALLPVGPLAFRVALASALCAAAVLGFYAHALELSLRALYPRARRLAPWWALVAALAVAQTPMFTGQALRAQPFMAQYVVALATIVALIRYELAEPHGDRRMLYAATFLQGLAFANHPVLALLLLGVSAPTLGRLFAGRGFMGVMGHAAAGLVGFTAYAYVPIRLAYGPEPLAERNLLVRTVAFLDHPAFSVVEPGQQPELLGQVVAGLSGTRHVYAYLLALLGSAALARTLLHSTPRRVASIWLLAALLPALGLAIRGRPLAELDAFGVLVPAGMGVFALAAIGLWGMLESVWRRGEGPMAAAAAVLLLAFGARVALASADLARAGAGTRDALDEPLRRALPSRTVVLTYSPTTYYHQLGAEAEERLRPDVLCAPLFADGPPGRREALLAAEPALAAVLAEQPTPARERHRAFAAQRPLFLDVGPALELARCPLLLPYGPFAQVSTAQVDPARRALLGMRERARLSRLVPAAHDSRATSGAACDASLAFQLARAATAHALCSVAMGVADDGSAWLDEALRYTPDRPALRALGPRLRTAPPTAAGALRSAYLAAERAP